MDRRAKNRNSMPALRRTGDANIDGSHRSKALVKLIEHLSPRKSIDRISLPKVSMRYSKENGANKGRNAKIDYRGLFIFKTDAGEHHPYNKSAWFTKSFSNWGMFRDTSMNAATNEKLRIVKREQILNKLSEYKNNHFLERTRK